MLATDDQRDVIGIDVHGGIHDGASSVLQDGQITVVGSATDCDICLRDPGVASNHLAISTNGSDFVVRPMEGRCMVNGKVLRAGQSVPVARGDRISLDHTDVWLATTALSTQAAEIESAAKARPRSRIRLYSCGALLAAVVAVSAQQLLSTNAAALIPTLGIEEIIATLEITHDVTVSRDAGVVTIRGIVPDEKFAKLELLLLKLPASIFNRTQSTSLLMEQVRSVFRTNGYHANLKYLGGGEVQVTNLDGENPKIQKIAGRARNDVPVLVSLTFLPVSDADRLGGQLSSYSMDPDKRLTTIVDGDTAYVATTDGGRYFVGSVLPGGLVLRDISADGIQVDDNGELYWLEL